MKLLSGKIMMISKLFVASIVVLHALSLSQVERDEASVVRIILDGQFDDWRSAASALVDPADAANSAVDFGEVRIDHDDRFVHLLVDFGRTVNAQGLDGTAMLLLDVDGDPTTGRQEVGMMGVDVIIDLTPPNSRSPGKPGMGIGLRSTTYAPAPNDAAAGKLNPYDIGFAFAPTHAGRRMEFRIERGAGLPNTPALFKGDRFSGKLVFVDVDGAVGDETNVFVRELKGEHARLPVTADLRQAAVEQSSDPLIRGDETDLRIMNWNVERGAIFTKSEPFARTFAAMKPDVVLLEELSDKNSAEQVHDFLEAAVPAPKGEGWHVMFGAGGGDLRCAIASRFPLEQIEPLKLIPFPDRPDRFVRAVGAVVMHHGKRLLVVSVHLKCCGRASGPEDEARKAEVVAIHQAIKAATSSGKIDGVIIGGDFNLVGSRDPIEMMAAGLDLDASALTIAEPYQLDGLSNATWFDPSQPFVPGRLDFVLFTDSTMQIAGSFVYDSRDLLPQWLAMHRAQADDTPNASDHLPIVLDVGWIRN